MHHSAALIFSSLSQVQHRMLQKINFNEYADSGGRQSGVETYGVIGMDSSDDQSNPNTTHPRPWHRRERVDDRINRQKVVEKGRERRIMGWEDKHGVKSDTYTHSLSQAAGKHQKNISCRYISYRYISYQSLTYQYFSLSKVTIIACLVKVNHSSLAPNSASLAISLSRENYIFLVLILTFLYFCLSEVTFITCPSFCMFRGQLKSID